MSKISYFEQMVFDRGSYSSPDSYDSVEHGRKRKAENEGERETRDGVEQEHQREWISDYQIMDNLYLDVVSPPFQLSHDEIKKLSGIYNEEPVNAELEISEPFEEVVPPSLSILKNFGSGFTRLKSDQIKPSTTCAEQKVPEKSGLKLSMGDILRLAGENFIKSSLKNVDNLSMLSHPFGVSCLGLSEDDKLAVELVQNLLFSAEKISQQNYKSASNILSQCKDMSSEAGTPVQRLAYYFSEALQEKIDRETKEKTFNEFQKKHKFDIDEEMMKPNPTIIANLKQMPYSQISFYTAVQAIIENVAESKKVHVVDLEIRTGIQYTVLMQALADRADPIKLLKITAVGTRSKETIEKTGEWLTGLAKSMNLPFSFSIVMVSDMLDLKQEAFEKDEDETVAVYASFMLRTMIAKQDRLEHLMKLLRDMNPSIVAVIEVEANHTSPTFVKRFIESLFFFGAYFDCLGDCFESDDPHRYMTESMYFGEGIRNIVATENEERTIRNANIQSWRSFFEGFGMIEEELSTASFYQASLLVKNFPCCNSCSLAKDDKCLTVGWKGTPLVSISAWKFEEY